MPSHSDRRKKGFSRWLICPYGPNDFVFGIPEVHGRFHQFLAFLHTMPFPFAPYIRHRPQSRAGAMYRTLSCLTDEHAAWVLPLSALVCWVSCHATFGLLKQARESAGWAATTWLIVTGAAAGAGIWST